MNKIVAHTSLYYFELSENWIHTQIKHLPEWSKIVFTNETKNLHTVGWQPLIYERRRELPWGVRHLDSVAMKMIGYYPSFYRRAKKSKIKLIHAHFGPMGFLSLGIARKLDIPIVTTFYGYDASELPRQSPSWQEDYKTLFDQGDHFLVEGPAMAAKLEKMGCPPQKITIQHLGIETDKYPLRASYPDSSHIKVLMAGRFVEKKGFIYGLRAFHKFLQEGGTGELMIVGNANATSSSQQLKEEMLHYVKDQGLGEAVSFPGLLPLEELKKQYYLHHVFMAPSVRAENGDDEGGLPVTVIEAAASGMALIGSRHCDIPEVIRPGETGLVAEERDVEQLCAHLRAFSKDPKKIKKMGRQATALIHQEYNAEVQGERLAKIYDALL